MSSFNNNLLPNEEMKLEKEPKEIRASTKISKTTLRKESLKSEKAGVMKK